MKSKSEFMSEYRSQHPEVLVYTFFEIICDVVGGLFIILNFDKLSSYTRKEEATTMVFIGLALTVFGVIFLCLVQSYSKKATEAYEEYLKSFNLQQQNTPNTNGIYNQNTVSSSDWHCPNCGKVNPNYVGTCGCGEVKPK